MAYFTKSEARMLAKKAVASKGLTASRNIYESIAAESILESIAGKKFDIFLSQPLLDADLVVGTKIALENLGLSVYVDWIEDAELDRHKVTSENARILRQRMRNCSSLLYLATDEAQNSSWMPWELGYFDGFKGGQVAIFPLTESADDHFGTQEYLGLYPIVKKTNQPGGGATFHVEVPNSKWMWMKSFGKGDVKWERL